MAPQLLLSLLLGGIYGAFFHFWQGKSIRDLTIYFLTGIIGFGVGQALGNLLELNVFMIGSVHVIEATVTSWASLFLMKWLKG